MHPHGGDGGHFEATWGTRDMLKTLNTRSNLTCSLGAQGGSALLLCTHVKVASLENWKNLLRIQSQVQGPAQ